MRCRDCPDCSTCTPTNVGAACKPAVTHTQVKGSWRTSMPNIQNIPKTIAAAMEMAECRVNRDGQALDLIKYGTAFTCEGKHVPYETTLKDMTMTLAILTTTLARFTVPEHLVRHWRENVLAWDTCSLEIYNAMGERIQFFGTDTVPSIWTHEPVPLGFPIESVNKQFEERAAALLELRPDDFIKAVDLNIHSFNDNRYYHKTVRMAWMIYLDRAVFDRS